MPQYECDLCSGNPLQGQRRRQFCHYAGSLGRGWALIKKWLRRSRIFIARDAKKERESSAGATWLLGTLATPRKMRLDVAPNGAGRLNECRSYKDFAPTELVIGSTG
jgi:hypothetical protein